MKRALTLLALFMSLTTQAAITIGAYNIRNFDYDERYRIRTNKPALLTMLKSLNFDVLSVEEINNVPEFANFITTQMKGFMGQVSNCGGEHGQHLGFLYNAQTIQMLSFNEDLTVAGGGCNSGSRPLAIALFQIKATGQKFYGMTAHLKSGSDPESIKKRTFQFEQIAKIMRELKTKTGVQDFYLAGDLNTTEYRNRGVDFQLMNKFTQATGLVDLAANLPCSAYWWGGTEDGIEEPTLLDHVLVTPGLVKVRGMAAAAGVHGHCQKVQCRSAAPSDLGVSYESVSDHCPVTATIQ